jgi:hypothetical protein
MTKVSKKIEAYKSEMLASFEARKAYEASKNADNASIQIKLDDMIKLLSDDVISVFAKANVKADFINRAERSTSRTNVYCAQKVINIARAILRVQALNHFSRAIFSTCVALNNAALEMTHDDAESACSLSVKTSAERESLVVKYAQHVAANTASTQSSSSINALQFFNVLSEMRDARNKTAYIVARDAYASQEIAKLLQIDIEAY